VRYERKQGKIALIYDANWNWTELMEKNCAIFIIKMVFLLLCFDLSLNFLQLFSG